MATRFKQDKGVAGLTILLSLVVTLFVIGLLVMIFVLMSGRLQTAVGEKGTTLTVKGESVFLNASGDTFNQASNYRDFANPTVVWAMNTSDAVVVGLGNFTVTGNVMTNATTRTWNALTVNYTATYSGDNGATSVINKTGVGIASVTDWFGIFITIGAMVVLILLTVIIIVGIRGSGMIDGGNNEGAKQVGTA